MGCRGRGGLRFGHNSVGHGASFACKPLNMRANPSMRTQTIEPAPGRRCPQACYRVNVRMRGPRCRPSGLRAQQMAHARMSEPACGVTGTRTATATATATNQSNFARNSHENVSNHEHRSLELQHIWMLLKNDRRELCATFGGRDATRAPHRPNDCGIACASEPTRTTDHPTHHP